MKTVSVQELQQMRESNEDFQLIDVREDYECEICTLDGLWIPMATVPDSIDKISKDKKVVIHCRSGVRSARTIEWLAENHGYTNLYNLTGGILAWSDEIDASVAKY